MYPFSLPAAVLLAGGAPTAVFNALVNPGEQRTSTLQKHNKAQGSKHKTSYQCIISDNEGKIHSPE